jgi:drug/metabolite transporter (DMT)-like permease
MGRVLASPLVNVLQKKLTNKDVSPELIVSFSYLFFVLLSIPAIIYLMPLELTAEFWVYILLLGVFDIFGNMFLVKSLKTIDLSVFGPLNSYKAVFAIVFSAILLNEIPTFAGCIGVMVIIAGSYFLNRNGDGKKNSIGKFIMNKGIVFRFLAILLTSIAAVFSKKAILLSSPLITLIFWSLIGWPISILLVAKTKSHWKRDAGHIMDHKLLFGLLFLFFFILQLFTLLTFERIFVGYSLALFQLSSLVSVLFGFHFFQEKNIKHRLIGSVIMVLGTVLIALFG